jgi:hypothetical protein
LDAEQPRHVYPHTEEFFDDMFQYVSISQFPLKTRKHRQNLNGMAVAQRRAIAFVPTKLGRG